MHERGSPHTFRRKRRERETWGHVGVPGFSTNVEKGKGRTQIGCFWFTFCGAGPRNRCPKGAHSRIRTHPFGLGTHLRHSRLFSRVYFSVHFQVTSASKFWALWGQKDPAIMFLGAHFEAIAGVGAKVKIELPFRREIHFRGSRGSKRRWISSIQLLEGVQRSSGVTFVDAFIDFGSPLGIQMDVFWIQIPLLLRSEMFKISGVCGSKGRRQRGSPPEPSECANS